MEETAPTRPSSERTSAEPTKPSPSWSKCRHGVVQVEGQGLVGPLARSGALESGAGSPPAEEVQRGLDGASLPAAMTLIMEVCPTWLRRASGTTMWSA